MPVIRNWSHGFITSGGASWGKWSLAADMCCWPKNNPEYIRELRPGQWEVKPEDKAADGSPLRPFIVWFGEPVPMIEKAIEVTETADVFVVIGTSLNVYPAAGLLNYVPARAPIYVIDPKPVAGIHTGGRVCHLMKGASDGMEELLGLLKK